MYDNRRINFEQQHTHFIRVVDVPGEFKAFIEMSGPPDVWIRSEIGNFQWQPSDKRDQRVIAYRDAYADRIR